MSGKSFWALRRKRTGTFEPTLYKSEAAAKAKADQMGMFDVVPLFSAAPVREEGGADWRSEYNRVEAIREAAEGQDRIARGTTDPIAKSDAETQAAGYWKRYEREIAKLNALAAREEAPAEAVDSFECDGCDGDRCVYVGSLCNPNLHAQPPAREDAQPVADEVLPVAWVIRTKDGHIRMWTVNETRAKTAAEAWGMEARQEGLSPIIHPAPDALRDAERYRYLRSRDPGPDGALPPAGLFIGRVPDNVILTEGDADAAIDQALAALQAEQKGGAA